nr:hypothetical protein [Kibdelosporangium sp. MJ126-NF4]CEL17499.1 hypothetical protein [Kibdelosporangium sp. MJ126-NF4]CTQ91274.1 hypothetical protein [Kibdelosporangium sp. MJ126-NF4]
MQASSLAIVDTDAAIRFLYREKTLGDYPSIADIRVAVDRLATSP